MSNYPLEAYENQPKLISRKFLMEKNFEIPHCDINTKKSHLNMYLSNLKSNNEPSRKPRITLWPFTAKTTSHILVLPVSNNA